MLQLLSIKLCTIKFQIFKDFTELVNEQKIQRLLFSQSLSYQLLLKIFFQGMYDGLIFMKFRLELLKFRL